MEDRTGCYEVVSEGRTAIETREEKLKDTYPGGYGIYRCYIGGGGSYHDGVYTVKGEKTDE